MAIQVETLPSWKHVWRNGFVPLLTTSELLALGMGLRADDARLLQSRTTEPLLSPSNCHERISGGCAIGYAVWHGRGLERIGDVHIAWEDLCWDCNKRMGEEGACRHFLNWWDDTPRAKARAELIAEIEREIELRTSQRVYLD